MVIDSGSTENIVSKKLVSTLNLTAEPQPNPYEVSWITKKGETIVKEICMVPLSISNLYQDQIICDVLKMDVCHVLLGRPWQYDNKAIHNGRDNTYEFSWMGKKVILLPLGKHTTSSKVPSTSKKQIFLLSQGKDLLYSKEQSLLAFVVKQDPFESPNNELLDPHHF